MTAHPTSPPKLPVAVLSGFLGAGKTIAIHGNGKSFRSRRGLWRRAEPYRPLKTAVLINPAALVPPMNDFDFSQPFSPGPSKADATRRIKQWVEGLQVLGSDGVVHVAELQCHEPGCPDFETVITLMYSRPSQDRTMKIFKPLAWVTQDEVVHAVLKSFADARPVIAALKAESAQTGRISQLQSPLPKRSGRKNKTSGD